MKHEDIKTKGTLLSGETEQKGEMVINKLEGLQRLSQKINVLPEAQITANLFKKQAYYS